MTEKGKQRKRDKLRALEYTDDLIGAYTKTATSLRMQALDSSIELDKRRSLLTQSEAHAATAERLRHIRHVIASTMREPAPRRPVTKEYRPSR